MDGRIHIVIVIVQTQGSCNVQFANRQARSHYTVNSEFSRCFHFRETLHLRSFVKLKPSKNGEITLSFTDVDKSRPRREFLT